MFLETICILHGEIQNRQGHEERMRQTASHFGFKAPALPDLLSLPVEELRVSKVKCRIIYHNTIEEISFERYTARKVSSLKLIEAPIETVK
jgi:4-amino-4-deoxychorismate lyase